MQFAVLGSGLARQRVALLLAGMLAAGLPLWATAGSANALADSPPETSAVAAIATWGDQHVVRTGTDPRRSGVNALARTASGAITYLHAVTTDDPGEGERSDGGIHFGRSADGGATWGKAKRLNGVTQDGVAPAIASSGSHVYVAWKRTVPGSSHSMIYVRRNRSHGLLSTWSDRIRLTSTTGRVGVPTIAASGASVYVAYTDRATGTVRLEVSRDRGVTWRCTALATTTRKDGTPQVVAAGRNVGIFWVTGTAPTVKGRVSTDAGSHWTATRTIGAGDVPSARALGTRIVMAAGTDAGQPWVRTWTAGAWGVARLVPHASATGAVWPIVALRGTTQIGVAFSATYANPSAPEETLSRMTWVESADGGASWGPEEAVSTGGPWNNAPSVVWRSTGALYVMWHVSYYDDGGHVAIRARL